MLELIEETHSALRRRFKGDLLPPQNHGYEEALAVWNSMVAKQVGAMARVREPDTANDGLASNEL